MEVRLENFFSYHNTIPQPYSVGISPQGRALTISSQLLGRQPARQTPGIDVAPPLLLVLLPLVLLPPFLCCWRCWLAGRL